jgi:5-formyltetrahydrofolate cyclo-ligase
MTAQADSASLLSMDVRQRRHQLRQQLRTQRRALPPETRHLHALRVAGHLQRAGFLAGGKRIGAYLAMPEELSLAPSIAHAWRQHCQVFIPHITQVRERQMMFVPFLPGIRLRPHRWGMLEVATPSRRRAIDNHCLDVVLLPLVGFDAAGHRLGMGAGFYDRYFQRRARSSSIRRPLLVGVAFAFQRVAQLPHAAHDVPLDAVVTERGIEHFHRAR